MTETPSSDSSVPAATASCARCEEMPTRISGPGKLYIWPPLDFTLDRLVEVVQGQSGAQAVADHDQSCAVVTLAADQWMSVCQALRAALTVREAQDSLALFLVGADQALTLAHVRHIRPLHSFLGRQEADWLIAMLTDNRLTNHFQPIFHAATPTQVFAHECLLRGTDIDGALVRPDRLFQTANDADMLFQLDRAARAVAVANASRIGVDSRLFINFTPTSVYNPEFCLRTTFEAVRRHGLDQSRIVFEVTETERIDDTEHLIRVLSHYRKAGFQVALDDLGAGYATLNLLPKLRPDYIKIDREMISGVDQDRFQQVIVSRLIEAARELAIRVVAEGIETGAELAWLQEQGVDFVQGFFLARPAPLPWQRS